MNWGWKGLEMTSGQEVDEKTGISWAHSLQKYSVFTFTFAFNFVTLKHPLSCNSVPQLLVFNKKAKCGPRLKSFANICRSAPIIQT